MSIKKRNRQGFDVKIPSSGNEEEGIEEKKTGNNEKKNTTSHRHSGNVSAEIQQAIDSLDSR